MEFLLWIVDGLAAGWLTGKAMSADGRGLIMDVLTGIVGGVGGGFLIHVAGLPVQGKMIYTNLAAILGAVVLTTLSRIVTQRRAYA
jgi:uncharacterized membrane protein YeaQ/YmgE (transglycosylase-associated protein family)